MPYLERGRGYGGHGAQARVEGPALKPQPFSTLLLVVLAPLGAGLPDGRHPGVRARPAAHAAGAEGGPHAHKGRGYWQVRRYWKANTDLADHSPGVSSYGILFPHLGTVYVCLAGGEIIKATILGRSSRVVLLRHCPPKLAYMPDVWCHLPEHAPFTVVDF